MKSPVQSLLTLLALALTLASAVSAHATSMTLDMTGSLGGSTELDGTPLGADTLFTLHAVFETPPATSTADEGWFSAATTLNLDGHGTLSGTVPVYLYAGVFGGIFGWGTAGVATSGDFANHIATAQLFPGPVPPFDPINPAPFSLSNPGGNDASGTLEFGSDTLSNLSRGDAPSVATISYASTVPEPSTFLLLGAGLAGLALTRKRSRRQ